VIAQDVLQLDVTGVPQAWISLQRAAMHYATGEVAWHAGEGPVATLRGGWNAAQQRQSQISVHPIIATSGQARGVNLFDVVPRLSRRRLVRRDRHTCVYCGQLFPERSDRLEQQLTIDHIVPRSAGGAHCWTNCAASCPSCNRIKGARTPEQAGMPLLFLPYQPSRYEGFLLAARHIRADVHQWLASRLPAGSRLH
jgi:hypothetical protein